MGMKTTMMTKRNIPGYEYTVRADGVDTLYVMPVGYNLSREGAWETVQNVRKTGTYNRYRVYKNGALVWEG